MAAGRVGERPRRAVHPRRCTPAHFFSADRSTPAAAARIHSYNAILTRVFWGCGGRQLNMQAAHPASKRRVASSGASSPKGRPRFRRRRRHRACAAPLVCLSQAHISRSLAHGAPRSPMRRDRGAMISARASWAPSTACICSMCHQEHVRPGAVVIKLLPPGGLEQNSLECLSRTFLAAHGPI